MQDQCFTELSYLPRHYSSKQHRCLCYHLGVRDEMIGLDDLFCSGLVFTMSDYIVFMGSKLNAMKMVHALAGVVVFAALVEEAKGVRAEAPSSRGPARYPDCIGRYQHRCRTLAPAMHHQGIQGHNSVCEQNRVWCQRKKKNKKTPISDDISIPEQNPRLKKGTNGVVHQQIEYTCQARFA